MQTWFETKVAYNKIDQDGRERKVTESYIIDAVSYTDAEARIVTELQQVIRGEFKITDIKQSNIIEIFPNESGEYYWKARIAIVTIDERAGKEKKVNNYFLVQADDFKEALQRLEEGLSYILVPYNTTSMALSPIVDVFPYFGDDRKPEFLEQKENTKDVATADAEAVKTEDCSMEAEQVGDFMHGDPDPAI